MKKGVTIFIIFVLIGISSFFLYQRELKQATYVGLPTVPCIDETLPIVQQYTITIRIIIHGQLYPLSPAIGHDYGNCLHDIYTSSANGTVHIRANDNESFTLGQFFDVWHKAFTKDQIIAYQTGKSHHITVVVNNKTVATYRSTPLVKHDTITISYW